MFVVISIVAYDKTVKRYHEIGGMQYLHTF